MLARIREQWLIPRISGVQRDYIRDREARLVALDTLDGISCAHLAFLNNSEIEPAAMALQETLDHGGVSESDRQLVAGDAWLCHDELRGADTVAVPDPY